MIFCRISTGKSTHAHAQWYNSLSVGNSLEPVATPACIWKSTHTCSIIQGSSQDFDFVTLLNFESGQYMATHFQLLPHSLQFLQAKLVDIKLWCLCQLVLQPDLPLLPDSLLPPPPPLLVPLLSLLSRVLCHCLFGGGGGGVGGGSGRPFARSPLGSGKPDGAPTPWRTCCCKVNKHKLCKVLRLQFGDTLHQE